MRVYRSGKGTWLGLWCLGFETPRRRGMFKCTSVSVCVGHVTSYIATKDLISKCISLIHFKQVAISIFIQDLLPTLLVWRSDSNGSRNWLQKLTSRLHQGKQSRYLLSKHPRPSTANLDTQVIFCRCDYSTREVKYKGLSYWFAAIVRNTIIITEEKQVGLSRWLIAI